MSHYHQHRARLRNIRQKYPHHFTLLCAVLIAILAVAIGHSPRPISSPEVKFTDASRGGLAIVPASCPSDPHWSGECDPCIAVSPSSITAGQTSSVTLSWNSPPPPTVAEDSVFRITNDVTAVGAAYPSGSLSITAPQTSTTYTNDITYRNVYDEVVDTYSCSANLTVNNPPPPAASLYFNQVELNRAPGSSVAPGDLITYRFSFTTTGGGAQTNIRPTVTIPTDADFAWQGGGTDANNDGNDTGPEDHGINVSGLWWLQGSAPAGATYSVDYQVRVKSSAGSGEQVCSTGAISSDQVGSIPSNTICNTVAIPPPTATLTVCDPFGGTSKCITNGGSMTVEPAVQDGAYWSTTNVHSCTLTGRNTDGQWNSLAVGAQNPSPGWGFFVRGSDPATVTLACKDLSGNPVSESVTLHPSAVTVTNLPDLKAILLNPSTAKVGVSERFYLQFSNDGDAGTVSSFTDLFQTATDITGSNIADLGTAANAVVGPKSFSSAHLDHTFNTPGPQFMRACADKRNGSDANGIIAESNENNNCTGWTQITVNCSDGSTPVGGVCPAPPSCPPPTSVRGTCVTNGDKSQTAWNTTYDSTDAACGPPRSCTDSAASVAAGYGCYVDNNQAYCQLPPSPLAPDLLTVSPPLVHPNETTVVSWTAPTGSQKLDCTITGSNGDQWPPDSADANVTIQHTTSPITSQTTYTLACKGAVTQQPVPPPLPSATVNLIPSYIER